MTTAANPTLGEAAARKAGVIACLAGRGDSGITLDPRSVTVAGTTRLGPSSERTAPVSPMDWLEPEQGVN